MATLLVIGAFRLFKFVGLLMIILTAVGIPTIGLTSEVDVFVGITLYLMGTVLSELAYSDYVKDQTTYNSRAFVQRARELKVGEFVKLKFTDNDYLMFFSTAPNHPERKHLLGEIHKIAENIEYFLTLSQSDKKFTVTCTLEEIRIYRTA